MIKTDLDVLKLTKTELQQLHDHRYGTCKQGDCPTYVAIIGIDRMLMDQHFKDLGLEKWHTGGGCHAWRFDMPGGLFMLVTGVDGGLPKPGEEEVMLGRFDEGDAPMDDGRSVALSDLESAMEKILLKYPKPLWFTLQEDEDECTLDCGCEIKRLDNDVIQAFACKTHAP